MLYEGSVSFYCDTRRPAISNAELARKLLVPYTVERKKVLTTDGTDLQPTKEPKAIVSIQRIVIHYKEH